MTPTLGLRRRLVGRRYHRSLIGNAPSSRGKTLTNESGETRSPHARYAQEARLSVRALLALRIAQAMRPAMTPNLIESMYNHTRKKPYFPRSARLDRHAVTSNTRQNPATRNGCPALPPCAVSEAGMRPRCSEPSPEAHRGGRPAHVRSGVALSSHKEVRLAGAPEAALGAAMVAAARRTAERRAVSPVRGVAAREAEAARREHRARSTIRLWHC